MDAIAKRYKCAVHRAEYGISHSLKIVRKNNEDDGKRAVAKKIALNGPIDTEKKKSTLRKPKVV